MLSRRHFYQPVLAFIWLWAATVCCHGFALLGPYEPWMDRTNGYRMYGDIGGPMDLHSEYRWNVPVVTYGFDQSFRDYFGSNGVAAVEAAIQILNNLPAASDLELTNFFTNSEAANTPAQPQRLYDLKSIALSLLVEQMGLTAPHQSIFVLKKWDSGFHFEDTVPFNAEYYWSSWAYPDYILQRNYDPATRASTHWVNDVLFSAYIGWYVWLPDPNYAEVRFFRVDPLADFNRAVADNITDYPYINDQVAGQFWQKGLTRDDAGGLRYLLSAANTNGETLLPGIYGTGTNAENFVNTAVRPGVEKITFVPQLQDGDGAFSPMTNEYVDTYITNDSTMHQTLARVTSQPDILFTASNLGLEMFERTGTSNWINNAALNGQPGGAGPGVICPPIRITFNQAGPIFYDDSDPLDPANQSSYMNAWGSFTDTTNPPIVYPAADSQLGTTKVNLVLMDSFLIPQNQKVFKYQLNLNTPAGTAYWIQTSTNLLHWDNVTAFTNDGFNFTFRYLILDAIPARFFRIQPQ